MTTRNQRRQQEQAAAAWEAELPLSPEEQAAYDAAPDAKRGRAAVRRMRRDAGRAAWVPPVVADSPDEPEVEDDRPVCSGRPDCWVLVDEPGEVCEACAAAIAADERRERFYLDTEAAVRRLAARYGWLVDRPGVSSYGDSWYYELSRETGEDETDVLTVRISDHGSLYCREDVSLALEPGGDDHDLDYLERRLAQ